METLNRILLTSLIIFLINCKENKNIRKDENIPFSTKEELICFEKRELYSLFENIDEKNEILKNIQKNKLKLEEEFVIKIEHYINQVSYRQDSMRAELYIIQKPIYVNTILNKYKFNNKDIYILNSNITQYNPQELEKRYIKEIQNGLITLDENDKLNERFVGALKIDSLGYLNVKYENSKSIKLTGNLENILPLYQSQIVVGITNPANEFKYNSIGNLISNDGEELVKYQKDDILQNNDYWISNLKCINTD